MKHTLRTFTVTALLGFIAAACGAHSEPEDPGAELARLRREHRAIKKELALLRAEVRHRPPAPAAERSDARRRHTAQPPSSTESLPTLPLTDLLDAYRVALESENLEFMRKQIYGGELPSEDARYLEIWFERTDELDVELEPRGIVIEGRHAKAVVTQTMSYRLSRTHETRTVRLQLRVMFERRDGEWRVQRVESRL